MFCMKMVLVLFMVSHSSLLSSFIVWIQIKIRICKIRIRTGPTKMLNTEPKVDPDLKGC